MLFVNGDAPAVFADVFSVFHQLFIFFQFLFHMSDVVQKTKMPLMARVGHMKIRHGYHLLSWTGNGNVYIEVFIKAVCRKAIIYSIVTSHLHFGKWVKHCI